MRSISGREILGLAKHTADDLIVHESVEGEGESGRSREASDRGEIRDGDAGDRAASGR